MKYLIEFERYLIDDIDTSEIDDFYQEEPMYYISFCEGESRSSVKDKNEKLYYFKNLGEVIAYSKKMVKKFNSKKLKFKVYYDENINLGGGPIMYFLFKSQKGIPGIYQPYPITLSKDNYLAGWKPDEVPNNDLDLFFDIKKYNL